MQDEKKDLPASEEKYTKQDSDTGSAANQLHIAPSQGDEINLLDFLIALVKHKRLIFSITTGAAVMTAIISLIMPPIYRAETKILPPQQQSSMASQMLNQLGAIAGFAGGSLGIKNPNDMYIEILKSRYILDRMVERFGLMERYNAKYREDAQKAIAAALVVQDNKKSGIITIVIEDKDAKIAAEMANAIVEELRSFTKGLAVTEASQRRLFFEEQLKDVKASLVRAEEGVKGFQERTGALQVDSQAKAVIEGIANLKAQIAAKEVELRVIKTYSTPHNPDVQKMEEALRGLKAELGRIEGRGDAGHDPLMPIGKMPAVGTEYLRKMRDLKYTETLYELLVKQYEAAKLDESRDAMLIQVIDKAISPEKRAKPKRTLMVMLATVLGFLFSIFVAFVAEYKEKAVYNSKNKERFSELRKHIKFLS